MGKKDSKQGKKAVVAKLPKRECCVAKTRCNRCPLRMLKEGTLPPGYTVRRRKLVKIEHLELLDSPAKLGKLKVKKSELKKDALKAAKAELKKSKKVQKKSAAKKKAA